MQLRSPLGAHAGLTLILALVACGCAATPPAMPVGPAATQAAARPMGRAVVDLTQVANALAKRHLAGVGFKDDAGIAKLRVKAFGPGMDDVTSESKTYTGLSGAITVDVPQGPNRIFRLEGLTSDGGVVASLATLANVTSTDPVSLSFDISTTAAAYTLKRLLDPLEVGQTDASGIRASLKDKDITDDLKAFVKKATGFDSGTNAISLVDPRYFRVQHLVNLLLKDGLAEIQPKKTSASPAAIEVPSNLAQGTKGKLALAIRTSDGVPVANASISGEVFDLNPNGVTASGTDESGTLTFADVGIGVFDVKLTLADGSVVWAHDVGVRDTGVSYATYTLPATAAPPPITVNSSEYNNTPALAENSRTHEKLLAWAAPSEGVVMRAQIFDDHGQASSDATDLGYAGSIKSVEAGFMQGATAADDRYVVSWLDNGGNLKLVSIKANGTAEPIAQNDQERAQIGNVDETKPAAMALPTSGLVALGWLAPCVGIDRLMIGRHTPSGGGWAEDSRYFGANDVDNLGVAAAGPDELLVTWRAGTTILAQRVVTNTTSDGWEGKPTITVASGVSGTVSKTFGAYDSVRNEYLVGWEYADATGGHVGLKHLVQATGRSLAGGSQNYLINDADSLSGSRLRYVSERTEFMLAYRSGKDNAIKMQKLVPSDSGSPPTPGTLTKDDKPERETASRLLSVKGSAYPGQVTFTYDSKASLYRAAWLRSSEPDGPGSLVLGSYRP